MLSGDKNLSLEEYHALLRNNDELRDEILEKWANDIQYNLCEYFEVSNMQLAPKRLSNEDFYAVYNPELPTIGVSHNDTYGGSELLGLAGYEEDSQANIIYIPTTTDCVQINQSITTGRSYLEVNAGLIVLPSGQVAYGSFPEVVRLDAFESGDPVLLRQCKEHGITVFQDADSMADLRNKAKLNEYIKNPHTYTASRMAQAAFMNLDGLENDIVIKPQELSTGKGVKVIQKDTDINRAKSIYNYLDKYGYQPLIEQRVHCFSLTDPETGDRLDWNARAILSYGNLVDMYIRADKLGKTVNICLSAQRIKVADLHKYVDDPSVAALIEKNLCVAAQAVAEENPYSILGIDLTVDEQMKTYIYEMDNYVGGVQTISQMEDTYEGKLAMSTTMLSNYIEKAKHHRHPSHDEPTIQIPLKTSFSQQVYTVIHSSASAETDRLDIDSFPVDVYEHYGGFQAMAAMRDEAYYGCNKDRLREIDEIMCQRYPLLVKEHLEFLFYYSYDQDYWKTFVDEYLEHFDPYDEEVLKVRKQIEEANTK